MFCTARISGDSARYVELTRCFPKSPQAYRAALELARRAQRTKNKQEAEKWWRWLLENAVGSPEWEVARKALQQR